MHLDGVLRDDALADDELLALSLWSPCSWITWPYSSLSMTVPLQQSCLRRALRTFSMCFLGIPWMVVTDFLPFRFWMRRCT